MSLGEADTCRRLIVPLLQRAGWDTEPHAINEQRTFTDGRVIFVAGKVRRGKQKRADYLLRYRPDFPIAVVEAKARYKSAAAGVQQAQGLCGNPRAEVRRRDHRNRCATVVDRNVADILTSEGWWYEFLIKQSEA